MVLRRRSVERRYQIGPRIATGAKSEVYEALSDGLSRPVVVKRLITLGHDGPQREAECLREATVMATLDHPNVAEAVDIGQYERDVILVMEKVEGPTLAELIAALERRKELLDPDLVCGIIAQVARGLAHAHDRALPDGTPLNIVHRDVSPENILIGTDGVPKLVDFGIATLEGLEVTTPGMVRAKTRYLSPEQARGEALDVRADVFGLGAVMFELLAGEPLYRGKTELSLMQQVVAGSFPAIPKRLPGIDADLVAIVERATDPDPSRRLSSARALERELDRFRAARGLRVDASTLARIATALMPEVEPLRAAARGQRKGELEGTRLVLPPDPAELRGGSGATDPAAPAAPSDEDEAAGPRRKRRLERLRRPSTPQLERPPSLARPDNPAGGRRGLSVLNDMLAGSEIPPVAIVVGVGVFMLGIVIGVLLLLGR